MESKITEVMEQFGYWGIFLLIALENVFPPIPSEVILTFGGFMTTYTNLTITGVVVVATTGSLAGAVVLYGIGRLVDAKKLETIIERWGKVLYVEKKDVGRANAWFARHGYWTVLFCRMVPLVRSFISIPAGMSHMRFSLFILLTTIGTLVWNVVLVAIGRALGESWNSIASFMDIYSWFVYLLLVAALGLLVVVILRRRKNHKEKK